LQRDGCASGRGFDGHGRAIAVDLRLADVEPLELRGEQGAQLFGRLLARRAARDLASLLRGEEGAGLAAAASAMTSAIQVEPLPKDIVRTT